MEKLREVVIKLASANQKEPLSSSQIALIDQRLHQSFPLGLRAPSHPTYASMILEAIKELNEQGGSSEESISEYIKANYDDLPWAHKSILSHHLDRLCEDGRIMRIAINCYSIPGFAPKIILKLGRVKRKIVGEKEKVSCQENLEECSERELRRGRRRLVLQKNEGLVGLGSRQGIEDESVENGCEDVVVVADKEEQKCQEAQESEMPGKIGELEKRKSLLITKQSIEMVKIRHNKRKSLVDVSQDKTMEDDNNGGSLMNNGESFETLVKKKKKGTMRVKICLGKRERECDKLPTKRTDEKSLADEGLEMTGNEVLALEDDSNGGDLMNDGACCETRVENKENDAEKEKNGHSERERQCDQLLTGGVEEKSLVDECQDETRKEILALDDESNGVDPMNYGPSFEAPVKKMMSDQVLEDAEEKSLVDECQDETRKETLAMEDDSNGGSLMNNGASSETPVMKKKDAEKVAICYSKRERKSCHLLTEGAETRKETLALEDDSNGGSLMNNGASSETPVKKKKDLEKVKIYRSKRARKSDQPLTEGAETRDEVVALKDDSNGGDLMDSGASSEPTVKKKKDAENVKIYRSKRARKSDQPLTEGAETRDEALALKEDSNGVNLTNNGASFETPVKKKKGAGKCTDFRLVCGIATGLPEPIEPERRVTRQLSKSKEQPNKLILSPVNQHPSSKPREHVNNIKPSIQSSQETKNDWPSWVQSLLKTTFFGKCKAHANAEENVRNFYCSDCKKGPLCTSCVASHKDHRVIKIEKPGFDDAVAVGISSIEMFVDISGIHTHKENATDSLVFLKKMPQTRRSINRNNIVCQNCKDRVPYPFSFCSLNCKYKHRLGGSSPCKMN